MKIWKRQNFSSYTVRWGDLRRQGWIVSMFSDFINVRVLKFLPQAQQKVFRSGYKYWSAIFDRNGKEIEEYSYLSFLTHPIL